MVCSQGVPQLVIVAPGSDRVRRIGLHRTYMVVGREPDCDVRFDDPHVSRAHAALQRRGNAVYVRDLGSFGGTFIGGTAVTTARELHPGDVVTFATVMARYEPASTAAADTLAFPAAALARPFRETFREIAMTRTRALWLGWAGFLVLAEGLITIIAATRPGLFGRSVGTAGPAQRPLGPDIADLPAEMLGWALAMVGFLLLTAGIGMRIDAAWRRR
jgi:hypothetical protein